MNFPTPPDEIEWWREDGKETTVTKCILVNHGESLLLRGWSNVIFFWMEETFFIVYISYEESGVSDSAMCIVVT